MPFRDRFDCLWCGTPHVTRAPSDLEGWAQLCPSCLGKAGSNPFLRTRLRSALTERGRAGQGDPQTVTAPTATSTTAPTTRSPAGAATRVTAAAGGRVVGAVVEVALGAVTLFG